METTALGMSSQPPYSPHLKKVLKTYQLSAIKSLQGPNTVLGDKAAPAVKVEMCDDGTESPSPEPRMAIQQMPILTTPDQRSERSETVLERETISCFVVGGEKRLCLPQVLNTVLREFGLPQINQVCDELQIYCSRCNPEQLEELKTTGILPLTAPSCGLITKTDAERLCSALLHREREPTPPGVAALTSAWKSDEGAVHVYHECFGKCRGVCAPELYRADGQAHCIECSECHAWFTPQRFVCHVHRHLENRTCHWGFDSRNWRAYLLVAGDHCGHSEKLVNLLELYGASNAKRKQVLAFLICPFLLSSVLAPISL